MADDFADMDMAAGFFYFVGEDGKDSAFKSDFRGDQARFGGRSLLFCGGWGLAGAGFLFWSRHKATVSSCIEDEVAGIQGIASF